MSNRGRNYAGRRPPADSKNRRQKAAQDVRDRRRRREWVKLGHPYDFIAIEK